MARRLQDDDKPVKVELSSQRIFSQRQDRELILSIHPNGDIGIRAKGLHKEYLLLSGDRLAEMLAVRIVEDGKPQGVEV